MFKISVKTAITAIILTMALVWIKEWGLLCAMWVITALGSTAIGQRLNLVWAKVSNPVKQLAYWLLIISASALTVVFTKTYLFDLTRLPSNSMEPNFTNGQILVINKLTIGPRLSANNPDGYSRAKGFSHINRFDIAVFNVPTTDSLSVTDPRPTPKKPNGWLQRFGINPISFRPRYIKRIVALPGDTFEIKSAEVYVNNRCITGKFNQIAKYKCTHTTAESLANTSNTKIYNSFVYKKDTLVELSSFSKEQLPAENIQPFSLEKNMPDPNIFPHTFFWNSDNMGPIVIPAKGTTVKIDIKNIALYRKIIQEYEGNSLDVKKTDIFINGEKQSTYTFKMNYYWAMGDNQPHSFDSRYWGFLPENHIIGVSRTHFTIGF